MFGLKSSYSPQFPLLFLVQSENIAKCATPEWVTNVCLETLPFFVNMYIFSFIPSWTDPQTSEFGEDVMLEDFFSLSLLCCYMNEFHEVFFSSM